ncbi:hypothetical protein M3Y97_00495200 [Aphelenchoides bicaudatus]|nr:hypothetical protein M3Y97_00495200 [Aphelenchoides bicaudatus]
MAPYIQRIHNYIFLLLFYTIIYTNARPSTSLHSYAKRAAELRELQEMFAQVPPHCSRAIVSSAAPSTLHESQWPSAPPKMRLNAGVGNTVCFRSGNDKELTSSNATDVLHTLTLVRLEQYYPISQRFRFAIPEMDTRCICECQADAKICQPAEYSYGKCPGDVAVGQPMACHRTFFADQPANGCPNGHAEEPKLCCELRFQPYQNKTFTALKLESSSTFGVLRYAAYEWTDRGRWSQTDLRTITVHLDGSTQSQFLDTPRTIELTITSPGQSNNQLDPGMYFVENMGAGKYASKNLAGSALIPKMRAFVQGGFVLMDKIHKAKAENCLEQKYQSILDANYYVNKNSNETTQFQLSPPLSSTLRWIKRARLVDSAERHALVDANEGTNLELILSPISSEQHIRFVHNASKVADFNALLLVDQFSNSFLNLSLFNASGVLNGYLKHISDSNAVSIDSFTVQVPIEEQKSNMKTAIVRVKPYEPNSQHMVCLRADDGKPELCRIATSVHVPLETQTLKNYWHNSKGYCADCNQFTMSGFMHFLNPANWVKGVHSVGDAVMLLSDIVGYVFVILLAYLLIFKLLIPLLKCFVCPASLIRCGTEKK